ncbi:MAG: phosphatase PAP2 family protein [Caulobacteraceae bacterium]
MRGRPGILGPLAAAAVLLASLQAATASGQALNGDPLTDRGYLRPDEIDASALLGPPPAPGSPRGIADWARFIETRSLEGSERWRVASLDVDIRSGAFARFSCAAGVTIDQQRTPATWKVLARLEYDVRTVGRPAKDRYGRLRPITGNTYSICEPRAAWLTLNASYPSGHSMIGWSYALTLAQLLPDRSEVLIENGKAYGESRIICGVHYQSDVEAGRLLASAMVARLQSNREFQSDMRRAAAELKRARGRGRAPQNCQVYDNPLRSAGPS